MAALEILLLVFFIAFLVIVLVRMDRAYRARQDEPKPPFKVVTEKKGKK